jgi:two-component system response regulator DctR
MNGLSAEKKSRILVVEDDPVLLGLVCGSLRAEGHDIIETSSPKDALGIPANEYIGIDLVVTEVNGKPISGIELSNRLMRRGVDVPMLFMSGSHSIAVVIARSLGNSAVIEQPFTGAELRTAVKKCLASQRRKPRPEISSPGKAAAAEPTQ